MPHTRKKSLPVTSIEVPHEEGIVVFAYRERTHGGEIQLHKHAGEYASAVGDVRRILRQWYKYGKEPVEALKEIQDVLRDLTEIL